MDNPDTPWLRNYETRSPKPFTLPPSPAAVFFLGFLRSKGIRTAGARLADIGCGSGRDSVYFARNGFEVHAIDRDCSLLEDLGMHGVKAHCHSATDCWLFEDGFFDFVIDVLCYGEGQDDGGRKFYRSELKRTLKPGGYFLLCVPGGSGSGAMEIMEAMEKEFASAGFSLAASHAADDGGRKAVSLVFSAAPGQPQKHL